MTYNGLNYVRSEYPLSPTAGTPPNQEMGTDPAGVPIRTWTLYYLYTETGDTRNRLIPRYFRLITDWNNTTKSIVNYQGMTNYARSAYENTLVQDFSYGYTADMDQDAPGFGNVPADKCGVALQQWQEVVTAPSYLISPDAGISAQAIVYHDLVFQGGNWIQNPSATTPYTYYVFLLFNHPLYFRRNFQLAYSWDDYSESPPVRRIVTTNITPTDKNYCRGEFPDNGSQSYFQPSNAVWTFALPTSSDVLGSVWVKDVESND